MKKLTNKEFMISLQMYKDGLILKHEFFSKWSDKAECDYDIAGLLNNTLMDEESRLSLNRRAMSKDIMSEPIIIHKEIDPKENTSIDSGLKKKAQGYILHILKKYSNKENPLILEGTQKKVGIHEYLLHDYNFYLKRKAIMSNIKALQEMELPDGKIITCTKGTYFEKSFNFLSVETATFLMDQIKNSSHYTKEEKINLSKLIGNVSGLEFNKNEFASAINDDKLDENRLVNKVALIRKVINDNMCVSIIYNDYDRVEKEMDIWTEPNSNLLKLIGAQ